MARPTGLEPFAAQSPAGHGATVLGGFVGFALAYLGTAAAVGDVAALAVPDASDARLVAGTVATACCFAWFGVAFTRGYGGPVRNATVYPVAIAVLAPLAVRWALFGPATADLVARLWFPPPSTLVGTARYAAVTLGAGLGAFALVLLGWSARFDADAERTAWMRTHLDPAFYEAFVDEGSRGDDADEER